jgi:hypothetical protein
MESRSNNSRISIYQKKVNNKLVKNNKFKMELRIVKFCKSREWKRNVKSHKIVVKMELKMYRITLRKKLKLKKRLFKSIIMIFKINQLIYKKTLIPISVTNKQSTSNQLRMLTRTPLFHSLPTLKHKTHNLS